LSSLGDPEKVHAYTLTTVAHHQKPNGKDAHDERVIVRVSVAPDGKVTSEMLQSFTDGVPVSAEEREAKRKERRGEEDDGGGFEMQMRGPVGEDQALYTWGSEVEEGGLRVAAYTPREGVKGEEGLGTGRLAWDPATHDPAWFEFSLVDNPMFVDSLHSRLEFGREGGNLLMERLVTEGAGGLPLMKRQFHMVMTVSDVE